MFLFVRNNDSEYPLISSPPSPLHTADKNNEKKKRRGFASAAFRGLGCAASSSSEAYAPAAADTSAASTVRSSPEWQGKRSRRRRVRQQKNYNKKERGNQTAAADVWCSPGIADDSVNCVVSHHSAMVGRGGRQDADRIQREMMMFQTRIMSEGMNVHDRYRDWRLDVDRMSYEELLELGDRIGYVSTGLREEEISRSLRKMKHSIFDASPLYFSTEMDRKCSICQEEYEVNDEMGKLECGHSYHIYCIKQWLLQKNACPICKTAVTKT